MCDVPLSHRVQVTPLYKSLHRFEQQCHFISDSKLAHRYILLLHIIIFKPSFSSVYCGFLSGRLECLVLGILLSKDFSFIQSRTSFPLAQKLVFCCSIATFSSANANTQSLKLNFVVTVGPGLSDHVCSSQNVSDKPGVG